MTEEQIKTINDTISAIVMYQRGELPECMFTRCLEETIGLPEEVLNHIAYLILDYKDI